MKSRSGNISLIAGSHAIHIEFFQKTGKGGCIFSYYGPGVSRRVVPASALIPRYPATHCHKVIAQSQPCDGNGISEKAMHSDVSPCLQAICQRIRGSTVASGKDLVVRGSNYGCSLVTPTKNDVIQSYLCVLNVTKSKYKNCGSWRSGDGIGGTEIYLGETRTAAECVAMVITQKPTANGVTYGGYNGRKCYAEFQMDGVSFSNKWDTCYLSAQSSSPTPPPTPSSTMKCKSWQQGDGAGGFERYMGKANTNSKCIEMVIQKAPTANGVTYSTSGHGCYAEYGMNSVSSSAHYMTCYLYDSSIPTPAPTINMQLLCLAPPRQVRAHIEGETEVFSYPTIAEHVFSNPHPDSLITDESLLQSNGKLTLEPIFAIDVSNTSLDKGRCCGPLSNNVQGKLVICKRGDCYFVDKVRNAQTHGAKAVMIVNHDGVDQIVHMGSGVRNVSDLIIPSVFVTDSFGTHLFDVISNQRYTMVTLSVCQPPNLDVIGYQRQKFTHCNSDKLDDTAYIQVNEAVTECNSNPQCVGIYDTACDIEAPFYLCKSPDTWRTSQNSCVLQKKPLCNAFGQWGHNWGDNQTYIDQNGISVTAINSKKMWSPASGFISGDKLLMFGMVGQFSQDCLTITWPNGALWSHERCPNGFVEFTGSVQGGGDLPPVSGVRTLNDCANHCNDLCKSFEWSGKLKDCQLMTNKSPTSSTTDKDFIFCAKFTESPTITPTMSSRTLSPTPDETCPAFQMAASFQRSLMSQANYNRVCNNCWGNLRERTLCKDFCKPCPHSNVDFQICDFKKCVECCVDCAKCSIDCSIGDLYCQCDDGGSCNDQLMCYNNVCMLSRNEPSLGPTSLILPAPTQGSPTPSPTPGKAYKTIVFDGNYSIIIGKTREKKTQFMIEFNNLLLEEMKIEDVLCIDVYPGSIVVMLEGESPSRLTNLASRLKKQNLHLPSFPNFGTYSHLIKPTNKPKSHHEHKGKSRAGIIIVIIVILLLVVFGVIAGAKVRKYRQRSHGRVQIAVEKSIPMGGVDETNRMNIGSIQNSI